MSIDIHFVAFMMISDFCLFDIPVDFVSPGMLQYAVGCRAYLYSVVSVSELMFSLFNCRLILRPSRNILYVIV